MQYENKFFSPLLLSENFLFPLLSWKFYILPKPKLFRDLYPVHAMKYRGWISRNVTASSKRKKNKETEGKQQYSGYFSSDKKKK